MFAKKMKMTSVAILMALSLTACGGAGNNDAQNTPGPTEPAVTASATPTATTSEKPMSSAEADDYIAKEIAKKSQTVDSIDLNKSFKEYSDPQVAKVFGSSFDSKAGAQFGLDFMQDLIDITDFYGEREAGSDAKILASEDFAERMDETLFNEVRSSIKEQGYFNWIPTANTEGSMGVFGGEKDTQLVPVKVELESPEGKVSAPAVPASKYNTPAISVVDTDAGDALQVRGERTITWETEAGITYEQFVIYHVSVVPSGDSWKVASLGWEPLKASKVVK